METVHVDEEALRKDQDGHICALQQLFPRNSQNSVFEAAAVRLACDDQVCVHLMPEFQKRLNRIPRKNMKPRLQFAFSSCGQERSPLGPNLRMYISEE